MSGEKTRLRTPTGGATRLRQQGTQKQTADQDVPNLATKMTCTRHLIDYYVPKGSPEGCPMCASERLTDDIKAENIAMRNQLSIVQNKLKQLEEQVNITTAVRSAIEVLNDEDYLWLKTQLYQYKIDKSVTLKPTHGRLAGGRRLKRGEKLPPNGFMAIPRAGDPYAHMATSIGGLAIAEYLDEAITAFGSAQAMGYMLRAWWKVLPGAES